MFFLTVNVATKHGLVIPILNINPNQIIKLSEKEVEAKLYEIGQELSKYIANSINVRYQWTGFENVEV